MLRSPSLSARSEARGSCEDRAHIWVHDKFNVGRIEDEIYRVEEERSRDWVIEFGLQHGPIRTDHAAEFGVM